MLRTAEHTSHPGHMLQYCHLQRLYTCHGCKEGGSGSCFRCPPCDFNLHLSCAIAFPTIYHPFHNPHQLQFFDIPPPEYGSRCCNACGNPVRGFGYMCKPCGYFLHPSCSHLAETLPVPQSHGGTLYLSNALTSACTCCGQNSSGWAYATESGDFNFHVRCARQILQPSNAPQPFDHGSSHSSNQFQMVSAPQRNSGTVQRRWRPSVSGQKMFSMAAIFLRVVIAALLGDPTTLVVEVVNSFLG